MIIQCPACRELAKVERALVDEGATRAGLACSACGEVTWLPADLASGDGARVETAATTPSAKTPTPTTSEGPTDPALREAVLGLPPASPDEEAIVEGLRALLPRWDDASGHRALIQRAQEAGALPALGVRYRRVLESRPGDEAAKRAQQEILNLALASFSTLSAGARADADPHRQLRVGLTVVAVGIVLVAAFVLLFYTLKGL